MSPWGRRWGIAAGLAAALCAPVLAQAPAKGAAAPKAGSPKATTRPPAPQSILPKGAEPDPATETEHRVKPGETLGGIAARAQVPRILIIEANGLKPPYGVRTDQVLVIPRRREHVTKPGETGFAIAMDFGVPWTAIAAANNLDAKARVRAGQKLVIPTMTKVPPPVTSTPTGAADRDEEEGDAAAALASGLRFAWPAPGKVRRGFVPRRKGAGSSEVWRDMARRKAVATPHDGIDITGAKGDPVRAAAPGLVWYAGKEPNLYGNVVIIDHGKGWFSAYAKLSKVTVAKGDAVRAGERVGLIGDTGSTQTTELHFEIRRKTVPIDPLKMLPGRR